VIAGGRSAGGRRSRAEPVGVSVLSQCWLSPTRSSDRAALASFWPRRSLPGGAGNRRPVRSAGRLSGSRSAAGGSRPSPAPGTCLALPSRSKPFQPVVDAVIRMARHASDLKADLPRTARRARECAPERDSCGAEAETPPLSKRVGRDQHGIGLAEESHAQATHHGPRGHDRRRCEPRGLRPERRQPGPIRTIRIRSRS